MYFSHACIVTALLALSAVANAGTVDDILAQSQPPPGVVFEIVDWNESFLEQALPQVVADIERLRARFPGLDVAVVSHGTEQFALMTSKSETYSDLHALTRELASDDLTVQVCGSHASWKGVEDEDFPDYVDVVASAPARINDYLSLDYVLVLVR